MFSQYVDKINWGKIINPNHIFQHSKDTEKSGNKGDTHKEKILLRARSRRVWDKMKKNG